MPGIEVGRRLVEHEQRRDRRARHAPATRAASRPPTGASRARAPRCRALRGSRRRCPTSPSASTAASTSASVASARPTRMLSRTVPANRKPSCGTTTIRFAQAGARRVAQVDAAEAHRALTRVVEADHQLGQRRLAGPGRPDERDPLPRLDGERHVAQHQRPDGMLHAVGVRRAAAVGERRVLDLDRARVGRSTAPGFSIDGAVGVEQPEDLVQRGARGLDRVVELAELLDRLEQAVQVEHEREHGADGDDPLVDEEPAHADDDRDAEDAGELDEREVLGRDADGLEVRLVLRLVGGVEPPDPAALRGRTPGRRGPRRGPPAAWRGSGRCSRAPRGRRGSTPAGTSGWR